MKEAASLAELQNGKVHKYGTPAPASRLAPAEPEPRSPEDELAGGAALVEERRKSETARQALFAAQHVVGRLSFAPAPRLTRRRLLHPGP